MPRRLKLEPHLTPDEIKKRFKAAREPIALRRWQVLYLVSQGKPTREIAETTTYHPQTIREIVWRFNDDGPETVSDGRRTRSRRQPPLLSPEQFEALCEATRGEAPGDRGWTGAEIARWMSRELGREVSLQRGWDYLQKVRQAADEDG